MAKHKRSKSRAAGAAALAGAAAYVGSRVVNELVKEAVSAGTDKLWHRGKHGKGVKDDIGLGILKLLAGADEPLPVGPLAVALKVDLLSCLEALHAMRRVRLVRYVDGRRAVELTPHGRETLGLMAPPEKDDETEKTGDEAAAEQKTAEASADGAAALKDVLGEDE